MDSTDTLQRWQSEEAAARGRQNLAPAPLPRTAVQGRAGLDVLRDMLEGRLPAAPIAHTMGFILIEVGSGSAVFQGRPGAAFLNPLGTLHGGWYATLLDSCVGCAVHTTLAPHRAYTTLELKFNLVRAIGPDVPLVRAQGQVVHAGRQVATAEGRLVGPDGKLYAHASTTCLLFDTPP
ncbi:MAG TPA: PaaI family thioesterase [Burkholderiaceae bacterium]|nr:PaaI family thioesterase [Burkholderiaceae bacterium]